jgi:hypothetical protein
MVTSTMRSMTSLTVYTTGGFCLDNIMRLQQCQHTKPGAYARGAIVLKAAPCRNHQHPLVCVSGGGRGALTAGKGLSTAVPPAVVACQWLHAVCTTGALYLIHCCCGHQLFYILSIAFQPHNSIFCCCPIPGCRFLCDFTVTVPRNARRVHPSSNNPMQLQCMTDPAAAAAAAGHSQQQQEDLV